MKIEVGQRFETWVAEHWAGLQQRAVALDAGCDIELVDAQRLAQLGIKASAGRFWYASRGASAVGLKGAASLSAVLKGAPYGYDGLFSVVGRVLWANRDIVLIVRGSDGGVLVRREVVSKAVGLWGRSTIEGLLPVDPKGKGGRLWFK